MNKIYKLSLLGVMCLILLTGCKSQSESMDSTLSDVAHLALCPEESDHLS